MLDVNKTFLETYLMNKVLDPSLDRDAKNWWTIIWLYFIATIFKPNLSNMSTFVFPQEPETQVLSI